MGAIGGGTAKRHRLWSNCVSILNEVSNRAGYLSRADMLKLPGDALVRKYVDGNGIARHAGIPGKLKKSQSFVGSCSDIWNGNIFTAQTQTLNIGIDLLHCGSALGITHWTLDFWLQTCSWELSRILGSYVQMRCIRLKWNTKRYICIYIVYLSFTIIYRKNLI